MNEPAQKQQGFRRLFPELSDGDLENFARYFDVAFDIARQDWIPAEAPFDNAPSIPTLKERSSSNLKNQS